MTYDCNTVSLIVFLLFSGSLCCIMGLFLILYEIRGSYTAIRWFARGYFVAPPPLIPEPGAVFPSVLHHFQSRLLPHSNICPILLNWANFPILPIRVVYKIRTVSG